MKKEISPEVMRDILRKIQQQQLSRQKYGDIRPTISTDFNEYKVVAVGSQIHWSKSWKTFHDFLGDYIKTCLGADWGTAELKKGISEMHPILQWYREVCEFQKKHLVKEGTVYVATCTGRVGAYLSLAYNLYVLRHHSLLQKKLIERLKNRDQFQGARYELYVIASFIKAGFDIEFEDEEDRTQSHCEFTATHRETKGKYSVEAKSRHRPGFLGQKGDPQNLGQINLRIGGLLNDALKKQANYPRIIFIDVNMPPEQRKTFELSWSDPLANIVKQVENRQNEVNCITPAFLFFTNHPYHYVGDSDIDPAKNLFFTAISIPEFKVNDSAKAQNTYPTIFSLWESINRHNEIPHDFDEI